MSLHILSVLLLTVLHIVTNDGTLLITKDSATGILAAIALPLQSTKPFGVDTFCSYNFEANYGMITEANHITDPLKRFRVAETQNGLADMGEKEGGEGRRQRSVQFNRRSRMITRKMVYHAIEEHLKAAGFNGRKCLLRAICEASRTEFSEHNGVLGDLVQIILTPSHSENENLPKEFYKAEEFALRNNCTKYEKRCPVNVMDMFSHEIDIKLRYES